MKKCVTDIIGEEACNPMLVGEQQAMTNISRRHRPRQGMLRGGTVDRAAKGGQQSGESWEWLPGCVQAFWTSGKHKDRGKGVGSNSTMDLGYGSIWPTDSKVEPWKMVVGAEEKLWGVFQQWKFGVGFEEQVEEGRSSKLRPNYEANRQVRQLEFLGRSPTSHRRRDETDITRPKGSPTSSVRGVVEIPVAGEVFNIIGGSPTSVDKTERIVSSVSTGQTDVRHVCYL
eukprot:Gb_18440 [translate_table: standard]